MPITWPVLIQLIAQVGLPLALKIIDLWKANPEPNDEVIKRLRALNEETLQQVVDAEVAGTPKPL